MENNKIFIDSTLSAWTFKAVFEHPDTSSDYEYGIFFANYDDEDTKEMLLKTFRKLWEKEGHYFHNLKVTATTYTTEYEGETLRFECSIEGGWYEDDKTLMSTYECKASLLRTIKKRGA